MGGDPQADGDPNLPAQSQPQIADRVQVFFKHFFLNEKVADELAMHF